MPDANRRIRQLRIKSQDENSISADINALQDAFNIASMPGLPPSGLLLVKKLDLGSFHTRTTSMAISQLIDEKLRSECYQPVCVDQLESPQQNVVWFSDSTEVAFALLELVIKGQTPTAWYWRVVFPSLSVSNDLSNVLNVVSRELPQSEIKPLALAGMMKRLIFHQTIESILEIITLPLAQTMVRAVRLYPRLIPVFETKSDKQSVYLPVIANNWLEVIKNIIQIHGGDDPRCHWLAFSALVTTNPALIESRLIWPSITNLIEKIALNEYRSKRKLIVGKNEGFTEFRKTFRQEKSGGGELDIEAIGEPFRDNQDTAFHESIEQANMPDSIDAEFKFEGLFGCEYSGFGFLIPLLDMLLIDELLAENPLLIEINFPVRILHLVAKRFGIDAQHPLLQALPKSAENADQRVENFVAPEDWKAFVSSTKNFDSQLYRPTIRQLEIVVQLLMSRFLYRFAKISLRSLIMREGQIAITRTHFDILFDIDQLDIRIRKTGLDINPGWVSWLGMVVQFHYLEKDYSDA
jgi:hypothetical protein